MSEPLSPEGFRWFLTFLVVGICAPWFFVDLRNFRRAMKENPKDPVVRDKRFGYSLGILIAVVGLVGAFKYHGAFG